MLHERSQVALKTVLMKVSLINFFDQFQDPLTIALKQTNADIVTL